MARQGQQASVRRWRVAGAAVLAALGCAAGATLPALAQDVADQTLRVSLSGIGAERVKTVPIAKRAGQKPRVAMSLPPSKVGPIRDGAEIWAGAELEVSVTCLEPMPKCVGKRYRFSPFVRGRLVLAPGPNATGPANTVQLGIARIRCSQEQPHRNHHCVLVVEGTREVGDAAKLPCRACNVNLVVDAFHHQARRGQVIVVGSDEDHGISQKKGTLNAAVMNPGPLAAVPMTASRKRSRRKLAIGGKGGSGPRRVLYSHRLPMLRQGEQLLVKARAVQGIGHLSYNVLMQSQLVVSQSPGSIRRAGLPTKVTSQKGIVTAQNGFNCTQGRSAHPNPCVIRKLGVIRVLHNARSRYLRDEGRWVPLYVNLVVQNRAIGDNWHRARAGDAARIARRGGGIEIRRYGPEFR